MGGPEYFSRMCRMEILWWGHQSFFSRTCRVIEVMMERLACHVGLVSNSHNQEDFSGGGTRVFYSNVSNGNSLVGGPEFF